MPKRKTHEEFICELAEISPTITVKGIYINANTRIDVKCEKCGYEWMPLPSSLVNAKSGCPRCAKEYRAGLQRKTHKQFLDELMRRGIDSIEVLEEYSGIDVKLLVRCKDCGNEWKVTPGHLQGGRGCPKCSGHHKRSNDEFVSEVAISNPDVKVLGVFKTLKDPIEAKCLKCGTLWSPSAGSLLRGSSCPSCAKNRPLTHEEFIARLRDVNPKIEILGRYQGMAKKIEARCLTCGTVWYPSPHNLLRGSTCFKCSYKKRAKKRAYNTASFSGKLKLVNPRIEVIGEYKNSGSKISVLCLDCRNEWKATPASLLAGHGCPNCLARSTSFMEQFILASLQMALGEQSAISRDKEAIGKELDIVLPDYKVAIEPGSWFWHKSKVDKDAEKRDMCKSAGIRLITIYDCFDGEEAPFPVDTLVYRFDLRSENGYKTLKTIVRDIITSLGKEHLITKIRWDEIEKTAERGARMMTNDEFLAAVKSVRPDVEVLSEFTNTKAYVQARCRACGHEWRVKAGSLLRGSGCRKCGRKVSGDKQRLSHEEYVSRLAAVNNQIEVIGKYTASVDPIQVRCCICDHIWEPAAISLTSGGHGCPKCWEKRRGKARIMPYEQFIQEFATKGNPSVKITGKYSKLSDRIEVKCKTCGYEWAPRAGQLLKGHGCPHCAGHLKMTNDQFVLKATGNNPDIEILSEYKNANTRVNVQCKTCGHIWSPRAIALTKTNPNGCPKCAQEKIASRQRRTTAQFIEELFLLNPDIEVLGEYVNANTKVEVRCKCCGHEWKPKPSYLLNMGKGCPRCK